MTSFDLFILILKVGLHGERAKLFTKEGAKSVKWNEVKGPGPLGPLTWYKVMLQQSYLLHSFFFW